jgi:hypothetical protein
MDQSLSPIPLVFTFFGKNLAGIGLCADLQSDPFYAGYGLLYPKVMLALFLFLFF